MGTLSRGTNARWPCLMSEMRRERRLEGAGPQSCGRPRPCSSRKLCRKSSSSWGASSSLRCPHAGSTASRGPAAPSCSASLPHGRGGRRGGATVAPRPSAISDPHGQHHSPTSPAPLAAHPPCGRARWRNMVALACCNQHWQASLHHRPQQLAPLQRGDVVAHPRHLQTHRARRRGSAHALRAAGRQQSGQVRAGAGQAKYVTARPRREAGRVAAKTGPCNRPGVAALSDLSIFGWRAHLCQCQVPSLYAQGAPVQCQQAGGEAVRVSPGAPVGHLQAGSRHAAAGHKRGSRLH